MRNQDEKSFSSFGSHGSDCGVKPLAEGDTVKVTGGTYAKRLNLALVEGTTAQKVKILFPEEDKACTINKTSVEKVGNAEALRLLEVRRHRLEKQKERICYELRGLSIHEKAVKHAIKAEDKRRGHRYRNNSTPGPPVPEEVSDDK
jgi:hypothetical protein